MGGRGVYAQDGQYYQGLSTPRHTHFGRDRRSMTFAIKAEASDPRVKLFAFTAQKTMYWR
jgi:hypothetical protein